MSFHMQINGFIVRGKKLMNYEVYNSAFLLLFLFLQLSIFA